MTLFFYRIFSEIIRRYPDIRPIPKERENIIPVLATNTYIQLFSYRLNSVRGMGYSRPDAPDL